MTLYDLGLIMLACQVKDHQPSMAANHAIYIVLYQNIVCYIYI